MSGFVGPDIFWTQQANGISTDLDNGRPWPNTGKAYPHTKPVWGGHEVHQPIVEPALLKSGFMSLGPNDTFYNRILIEPPVLALGNLLSAQTRNVSVWNGFLVEKELSNFQANSADGISVLEPVVPPYMMAPLEQLNYTVNITLEGPATINASFTWTIDGEDYSVAVTGSRVVVFPFGPNWRLSPVTETLAWMSDVMRSFNGEEQRRSVRTKARRSFSYTMSVSKLESSRFDNILWGWQNRVFALPVWTDKTFTSGDTQIGDTFVPVVTNTYSFQVGATAVLFNGPTDFEVVEVLEVNALNLRTTRPIEKNWLAGSTIYPLVLGHLPTDVAVQRYTGNTLAAQLVFDCDPIATDPFTPAGAAPVTYEGVDVITRQPNWKSPLQNSAQYMFDTVDANTGKITWDQTEKFARQIRSYSWLLSDRTKILDFRKLLNRLRGKVKTAWVPTWYEDFKVVEIIGSGSVGIVVLDNGFRILNGIDPARNRLMMRLKNGAVYYREIQGLSEVGANTILTINQSFGVEIRPADIQALHILMRSRLATDQVELVWQSNEVVTVDTSFTTVKN